MVHFDCKVVTKVRILRPLLVLINLYMAYQIISTYNNLWKETFGRNVKGKEENAQNKRFCFFPYRSLDFQLHILLLH